MHRFAQPQRASSNARGYGSKWRAAALGWLRKHPECVDCGAPATDVDHLVPHRGDMAIFWDSSLWVSRCHPCHSRKTVRFDGGFGFPRRRM